jgi:hypothetical protein
MVILLAFVGAIVGACMLLGVAMFFPSHPPPRSHTISRPAHPAPRPALPPVAQAPISGPRRGSRGAA